MYTQQYMQQKQEQRRANLSLRFLGTCVFFALISCVVWAQDPLLPKPTNPVISEPPVPEIQPEAQTAQPSTVEPPQEAPTQELKAGQSADTAPTPEPEQAATIESEPEVPSALSQEEVPPYADASEVEVEKPSASEITKDCHCVPSVNTPYRQRRDHFGSYVGVQSGTYIPKNYTPDFVSSQLFEDYFDSKQFSLIEGVFTFKWNSPLGSIGATATAGSFKATSKNTRGTLSTNPITAGLSFFLDTLFKEPYVVPYATGGAYTVFYKETLADQSVEGRTPYRPFYAAGLAFQLDWIDEGAHMDSYKDFGLENTYLFVEARQFMRTSDTDNPDFSTAMHFNAGLKFEF